MSNGFGHWMHPIKMMKENEQRIKGKLNFFMEEKMEVHIKKIDRQFRNGYVLRKKNDDVFIFSDNKLGECLLFVEDIYEVEEKRMEDK